jgi:hypothetical protein
VLVAKPSRGDCARVNLIAVACRDRPGQDRVGCYGTPGPGYGLVANTRSQLAWSAQQWREHFLQAGDKVLMRSRSLSNPAPATATSRVDLGSRGSSVGATSTDGYDIDLEHQLPRALPVPLSRPRIMRYALFASAGHRLDRRGTLVHWVSAPIIGSTVRQLNSNGVAAECRQVIADAT